MTKQELVLEFVIDLLDVLLDILTLRHVRNTFFDHAFFLQHICIKGRPSLEGTTFVLSIQRLVSITQQILMKTIHVNPMNDSIPLFTRKTKIESLVAKEEDNGTLQNCQDILLLISCRDVAEQAEEILFRDGGSL